DEKEISRFVQLQQQASKPADSTIKIILPDESVYSFPGEIALLDRAVDPQTGTIKARVVFSNPKGMLKPGLSCRVRVESNGKQQKILIPYKAVVEQMGEFFVYVVKDSTVAQSKVILGTRINENIIVENGLEPNLTIAIEGIQKLRDGARVQVSQSNSASAIPVPAK
ncbi:MAG: efflux RND transporter periplasmic adaptor subunit, partial [Chitinophagaceae bacterium]